MDIDYGRPPYVTVPEGYMAPKPEPSKRTEELDLDSHPLREQYDSSCECEFLGPEGIGRLFPRDQEEVASDEVPREGRIKSLAQRLKKR